jgi:uncharacterized protein
MKISRRKFLRLGALALPAALGADARLIEPKLLRITRVTINPAGELQVVHFSDFHYKGDKEYASEVVEKINSLAPDFVCFTGDLVEDKKFVPAALEFIQQIKAPVYGSPGNHDYRCGARFADYQRAFAATGGGWLADRRVVLADFDLELVGLGANGFRQLDSRAAARRIMLVHYPYEADRFHGHRFDLLLAGHSHGGQVRLPFYGAITLPWGVGRYEHGYYETPAGPLYVNAGIGTYHFPWRFNCRPELTLLKV